eukprot:135352-Rhodomonas_salina.1
MCNVVLYHSHVSGTDEEKPSRVCYTAMHTHCYPRIHAHSTTAYCLPCADLALADDENMMMSTVEELGRAFKQLGLSPSQAPSRAFCLKFLFPTEAQTLRMMLSD